MPQSTLYIFTLLATRCNRFNLFASPWADRSLPQPYTSSAYDSPSYQAVFATASVGLLLYVCLSVKQLVTCERLVLPAIGWLSNKMRHRQFKYDEELFGVIRGIFGPV